MAWKTRAASADELPFDAWSLPRLTSYLGTWVRHGGWYPDRKIRLWRQGTGDWQPAHEGGMLHEAWVPQVPSRVGQLKGDLHHHSYHHFSDHLRQLAKFSTLGAADARLQGRTSHALKPWFRMAFQWFKQAVVQSGWRDGATGLRIARWSAVSAHWKWRQVRAARAWDSRQTVGIVRTDALGDNVLVASDGRCLEGPPPRGEGGVDLQALRRRCGACLWACGRSPHLGRRLPRGGGRAGCGGVCLSGACPGPRCGQGGCACSGGDRPPLGHSPARHPEGVAQPQDDTCPRDPSRAPPVARLGRACGVAFPRSQRLARVVGDDPAPRRFSRPSRHGSFRRPMVSHGGVASGQPWILPTAGRWIAFKPWGVG